MERRPTGARTLGWITDRLNAGAARLNRLSDRIEARRTRNGGRIPAPRPGRRDCRLCDGTGEVTFTDLTGSSPRTGLCPVCFPKPPRRK